MTATTTTDPTKTEPTPEPKTKTKPKAKAKPKPRAKAKPKAKAAPTDAATRPAPMVQDIPVRLIRGGPGQHRDPIHGISEWWSLWKAQGRRCLMETLFSGNPTSAYEAIRDGLPTIRNLASRIAGDGFRSVIDVVRVPTHYLIIDGERRLLAYVYHAVEVGLDLRTLTIPAYVDDDERSNNEHVGLAIGHNIGRAELNPIEQARVYKRLLDEGQSTGAVAASAGVSSSLVTGRVRLLELDPERQSRVARGILPINRALLYLDAQRGASGKTKANAKAKIILTQLRSWSGKLGMFELKINDSDVAGDAWELVNKPFAPFVERVSHVSEELADLAREYDEVIAVAKKKAKKEARERVRREKALKREAETKARAAREAKREPEPEPVSVEPVYAEPETVYVEPEPVETPAPWEGAGAVEAFTEAPTEDTFATAPDPLWDGLG